MYFLFLQISQFVFSDECRLEAATKWLKFERVKHPPSVVIGSYISYEVPEQIYVLTTHIELPYLRCLMSECTFMQYRASYHATLNFLNEHEIGICPYQTHRKLLVVPINESVFWKKYYGANDEAKYRVGLENWR